MALAHPLSDQRQEVIAHVVVGRTAVGIQARRVGERITVVAPIRGMEVDEEIGLPVGEQGERPRVSGASSFT